MSGSKILEGLKDAVAGNFASVTIEGQRWVRDYTPAALGCDIKAEASRRYPALEGSIYDEDDNQASHRAASQRQAFIGGAEWSAGTKRDIAAEIYRALETLGAKSDILSIVGSYGDTISDADTLAMLKGWNAAPPVLSVASVPSEPEKRT